MKSRRRIACPKGSEQAIVASQTDRLEVVKTALSNVRFGSEADMARLNFDVRFTPESRHSPTRSGCPLWATSGLMQRSKKDHYSITSSAATSRPGGTVRPSAFAVLRLMTESGHSPLHPIITSRPKSASQCEKLNHADEPMTP
jgi:hypothetical protein